MCKRIGGKLKNITIKTIKNDEDFLRQISSDVDFEIDNYNEWIKMLKDYCKENAVYALTPVQIGIPKRIIYLKNTTSDMSKNIDSNYDESIILINPIIIEAKGHTRFIERCASCLDYVAIVDRPFSVKVEYYDINGNKKHEIFEGFKSTVFSHEYDHLNGILHIDIGENVKMMSINEVKEYRKNHPYEIISKEDKYYLEKNKRFVL